ncbi:helix-turn-helix transcriptional regulator [Pseudoscardovia radai]|uniref:helix-turn-helix transcriptional regulator n=1 Tax=Pseudoscardovia radai TaxID=987066 RepID=UPI003991C4EA
MNEPQEGTSPLEDGTRRHVEEAIPKGMLRGMREFAGITQASLARQIGVTLVTVSRWESPSRPDQKPTREAFDAVTDTVIAQEQAIDAASRWIEEYYLPGEKVTLTWRRPDDPDYPAGMPAGLEDPSRSNQASLRLGEVLLRAGRKVRFAYPDEDPDTIDQWTGPGTADISTRDRISSPSCEGHRD